MSASIVTFANLGKKKNLKTTDVVPVIDTCAAAGELKQVICQINEGFSFRNTKSAFPNLVRYVIGVLRRIPGLALSRQTVERLFDFFAARKLVQSDITFLHGGYFLGRTAQRARELGSVSVDIAVSAHLSTNAALERTELAQLGFPEYEGLYMQLERKSQDQIKFDYMIAMSEFARNSYAKEGFSVDRIFVAQPDIDLARFVPVSRSVESTEFRVLYVAHTQPLKGLHYLLEAWKNFNAPEAELVIVGGFSDMPEALKEQYINSIQADSRITWIPGTDTPEKQYCTASVLVFPSLTEGFGRVTLEAMACGLPVITTENAQGIVEDGKTGFVVPIRDSASIHERLEFLYHNPTKREEMGTEARRAAEEKKPFGEAVYEIYRNILSHKDHGN